MSTLEPFNQNATSPFDSNRQLREDGTECWSARDLFPMIGYDRWERAGEVVDRASIACEAAGNRSEDHLRASSKMVEIGSGARRQLVDAGGVA